MYGSANRSVFKILVGLSPFFILLLFAKEVLDHHGFVQFLMTGVSGRCIDARGQKWKVTQEGDHFFLIKGRIWTSGGVLYREGKSGIAARSVIQLEKDIASEMSCCACYAFTSACCF